MRGRHDRIADLERHDIGAVASEFPARIARLHDHRLRAIGSAQRLQRQCREQLAVLRRNQRRLAHDAVPVRRQADETEPRRRVAQRRQGLDRAGIAGLAGPGRRAEGDETRLRLDLATLAVVGEEIGERDIGGAEGRGQRGIIVGQLAQRRDHVLAPAFPAHPLGQARGRSAVGLRKDDIEGDGGGARFSEAPGQIGDIGAGPGPLAEPAQGLIVDVDDPDAGILIDARLGALIAVEQQGSGTVDRRHPDDLQDQHHRQHGEPGQDHPGLCAQPLQQRPSRHAPSPFRPPEGVSQNPDRPQCQASAASRPISGRSAGGISRSYSPSGEHQRSASAWSARGVPSHARQI